MNLTRGVLGVNICKWTHYFAFDRCILTKLWLAEGFLNPPMNLHSPSNTDIAIIRTQHKKGHFTVLSTSPVSACKAKSRE
ncbi:hypothetical protein FKM82_010056 [Ascaphus truei]